MEKWLFHEGTGRPDANAEGVHRRGRARRKRGVAGSADSADRYAEHGPEDAAIRRGGEVGGKVQVVGADRGCTDVVTR
ncbi:hypothetical protein GCM10022252_21940 [Streptosporangium oxazolinicum]|uniref:Uncharacterized protein n=1 Tax=Streptosporangium oxazolinicum TaxID=909287 RepID=A0ABP8APY9_9ACTN